MNTAKSITIIIVLLLNHNILDAQTSKPGWGMVNCSDLYWVDEIPITVDSWLSYYYWMLEYEGEEAAENVLPDSTVLQSNIWTYFKSAGFPNKDKFLQTMSSQTGQIIPEVLTNCPDLVTDDDYYPQKKIKKCYFGLYPMTGLTWEQAVDFCEWRTAINGDGTIVYELPSESDWKVIASMGLNPDAKLNGMPDSLCSPENQCALFNYRLSVGLNDFERWGKEGMSLKKVGLWSPDISGIFDLFGNVSEMTSEKGISKGGNYMLYANECHIDSVQYYNKPENWLGFRCIVRVK